MVKSGTKNVSQMHTTLQKNNSAKNSYDACGGDCWQLWQRFVNHLTTFRQNKVVKMIHLTLNLAETQPIRLDLLGSKVSLLISVLCTALNNRHRLCHTAFPRICHVYVYITRGS